MSFNREDLIKYRLEKSGITFKEANALYHLGYWNGAANRLYYSCFYAVIALLAKDDIAAHTHHGVRTEFFRNYIKTGLLGKKYSEFYSNLMGKCQESDYADFQEYSEEDVLPFISKAKEFLESIRSLILVTD
jgi:uncharacterized protein (UPF0332 family)